MLLEFLFPSWLININYVSKHLIQGKLIKYKPRTYLCHYHVLAFLHIFAICLHNGLQEPQVLHMAAMCLDAVHKVLHNPLADFIAQMVIVHEDVPHGFCFKELNGGACSQNNHKNNFPFNRTQPNLLACDWFHIVYKVIANFLPTSRIKRNEIIPHSKKTEITKNSG